MNPLPLHRTLIALVLIATTVVAEEPAPESTTPEPSELLARPIALDCGLTIREWRGTQPNSPTIEKLNALCSSAKAAFIPFIKARGLSPKRGKAFRWSLALIPDGYCHRCLNDIHRRFRRRGLRQDLWGYTGRNERYIWTTSETDHALFAQIFAHEVFHALSMFHGIYDAHHPFNNWQRARVDEELAQEFTESLGLGR